MYLLPVDVVSPHINHYYLSFRVGSTLLGFMSCPSMNDSVNIDYFSVDSKHGRVVPVFLVPNMKFDSDDSDEAPGWALYFMGCDDGSTGLKFKTRIDAMLWIDNAKYGGFADLMAASWEQSGPKLYFHN
jgi:hypothetical protein